MLSIVSVNDCVSFCDVCLCFDCYSIDSSFSNNRCRRYLLLLVIQPWEYLIKLSDWLIVVYVCMVLLLAFMNDCVAFCDVFVCVLIGNRLILHFDVIYFISNHYYSMLFYIYTTTGMPNSNFCYNYAAASHCHVILFRCLLKILSHSICFHFRILLFWSLLDCLANLACTFFFFYQEL